MAGKVVHLLDDGTWLVPAGASETAGQALARAQHSVAGSPSTLAILRRSHAADGAPPPAGVVRLLSRAHKVVAVATVVVQQPVLACVVDVYQVTANGTTVGPCVSHSVPLPEFLRSSGWSVRLCPHVAANVEVSSAAAQSSGQVLMVAPAAFQSNSQAAEDNAFMAADGGDTRSTTNGALAEHAGLVAALTAAGVKVHIFTHSAAHGTPDACFPNNWFICASDGTLALCPMRNPNRQAERRQDLVQWLQGRPGCKRLVDLTSSERESPPRVVEGTGSLVIDHLNSVAYMARSERSDEALALEIIAAVGVKKLVAFDATDSSGRAIYHTNVLLAIGTGVAVVCAEAIPVEQRSAVVQALGAGGAREIVAITHDQMRCFCGNVLEVQAAGVPVMAMSTAAHNAFTAEQKATMLRHVARLVHAPLDTIERVGGGGVRCCIGELFH